MNENSVNTRLRGIRAFFNYCIQLGYTQPLKMQFYRVVIGYTTEYTRIYNGI